MNRLNAGATQARATALWPDRESWITAGARGITATLVHVSATGALGFFLGLMRFSTPVRRPWLAVVRLEDLPRLVTQLFLTLAENA